MVGGLAHLCQCNRRVVACLNIIGFAKKLRTDGKCSELVPSIVMGNPRHHILVTSFPFVFVTLEEDKVTNIKADGGSGRVTTRLHVSAWRIVILPAHILIEN